MPTPSSDVQRDPRPGATRPAAATAAPSAPGPSGVHDDADTMRFRAATLEEAIALAEHSLGARVRVVAANRIRRGGIGGFFASDLGVEVTVSLDDETMEDALARLVAESEADERARWSTRAAAPPTAPATPTHLAAEPDDGTRSLLESFAAIAARAGAIADAAPAAPVASAAAIAAPVIPATAPAGPTDAFGSPDVAPHAVNPVLAEVLAAIMAEAAQARDLELAGADDDADAYVSDPYVSDPYEVREVRRPVAPATPTPAVATPPVAHVDPPVRHHPSPTMVRVEQIIEELSAITAAPVFGDERARPTTGRRRLFDVGGARARGGAARGDEAATTVRPTLPDPAPARPKALPTLPPRPSDIARAAAAASAASHERLFRTPAATDTVPAEEAVVEPTVTAPAAVEVAPQAEVAPHAEVEVDTMPVSATEAPRLAERPASTRRLQVPVRHADGSGDAPVPPATGVVPSANAPSRRQVELAVAAADQLIESLSREDGVKRLSVRVVLRTGDQREVEAEAEWEAE